MIRTSVLKVERRAVNLIVNDDRNQTGGWYSNRSRKSKFCVQFVLGRAAMARKLVRVRPNRPSLGRYRCGYREDLAERNRRGKAI